MNIEERKKQIVDEYFSLTGDKLTNDDPIITLIIYIQLSAGKTLNNSQLNENMMKTLHEINECNQNLVTVKDALASINLNRLQIVNEISALNKTQIYNEFKEMLANEVKEKSSNEALKRIESLEKTIALQFKILLGLCIFIVILISYLG